MKRFATLFLNSAKIYLPVHFIVLLLRLRKAKGNKLQILLRGIKEFIGSCLFGTCFAMSIPGSYAYISSILPRAKYSWIGNVIGFLFSWAIFFDSSSRWAEMSIYVLAQWLEGFTYSIYKRKYAPVVSHWEVGTGSFRNMCLHWLELLSHTATTRRKSCQLEERSEARWRWPMLANSSWETAIWRRKQLSTAIQTKLLAFRMHLSTKSQSRSEFTHRSSAKARELWLHSGCPEKTIILSQIGMWLLNLDVLT